MTLSQDRPGYAEILALEHLAPDDPRWTSFMESMLGMPLSTLPAVKYAVGRKHWQVAKDPIKTMMECAEREAIRKGLIVKPAEPKEPKRRRRIADSGEAIISLENLAAGTQKRRGRPPALPTQGVTPKPTLKRRGRPAGRKNKSRAISPAGE